MLGQIDFAPWQCLAELIDNAFDSFLDGRAGRRPPTLNPRVEIDLPNQAELDGGRGELVIRDNGPGMTEEELGKAVKAGYSGNDPVEKLGLFGMGFNIATARLGKRTEVRTTTAESEAWLSVVIDFDQLERSRSFSAPLSRLPKSPQELQDGVHGTEIRISKLEAPRLRPLIWGRGKGATRSKLGKIYGRVMENLAVSVKYEGEDIRPRRHCVWDAKRSVPTAEFGNVPAVLEIDEALGKGEFCTVCWAWLEGGETTCPSCGSADNITSRERRVKGWLGIQRYFDKDHFGIDLIRNGRVIEELDKSLFYWVDPETSDRDLEYPVDALHWGGRIVGELEIDFVRVSHQKDAFDKLDPEWAKVVSVVRGSSPIRPNIAKRLNLGINTSHLARLFAGYRAGYAGLKCLVPGDASGKGINDRMIMEWVEKFHLGWSDFQSDEKWYELVLQAEDAKKGGTAASQGAAGTLPIAPPQAASPGAATPAPSTQISPVQPNIFESDPELSGSYKVPSLPGAPEMTVDARRVSGGLDGKPIRFDASGSKVEFRFDDAHEFFERSLTTPRDCLVNDLCHRFLLMSGAQQREWPLAMIEHELRKAYFPESLTDVSQAVDEAQSLLHGLREHLDGVLGEAQPIEVSILGEALVSRVRKAILESELGNEGQVQEAIRTGRFVRHTDAAFLVSAVRQWPQLVLDGRFLSVPYANVAPELRTDSMEMAHEAFRDALWLISESGGGAISKDRPWRLRYARALASLRLLESWRV
jgi:hypothetical protein